MATTVTECLAIFGKRWSAKKAKQITGVAQFNLSDVAEGDTAALFGTFANAPVTTATAGVAPTPLATFTMKAADFIAFINLELKTVDAWESGKLKAIGDFDFISDLTAAAMSVDGPLGVPAAGPRPKLGQMAVIPAAPAHPMVAKLAAVKK